MPRPHRTALLSLPEEVLALVGAFAFLSVRDDLAAHQLLHARLTATCRTFHRLFFRPRDPATPLVVADARRAVRLTRAVLHAGRACPTALRLVLADEGSARGSKFGALLDAAAPALATLELVPCWRRLGPREEDWLGVPLRRALERLAGLTSFRVLSDSATSGWISTEDDLIYPMLSHWPRLTRLQLDVPIFGSVAPTSPVPLPTLLHSIDLSVGSCGGAVLLEELVIASQPTLHHLAIWGAGFRPGWPRAHLNRHLIDTLSPVLGQLRSFVGHGSELIQQLIKHMTKLHTLVLCTDSFGDASGPAVLFDVFDPAQPRRERLRLFTVFVNSDTVTFSPHTLVDVFDARPDLDELTLVVCGNAFDIRTEWSVDDRKRVEDAARKAGVAFSIAWREEAPSTPDVLTPLPPVELSKDDDEF